jgi:hypothetical protein
MTMINLTSDTEPLKRKTTSNGAASPPNDATNENEEKSLDSQPQSDDEEAAQFVENQLDSDSDSDKVSKIHQSQNLKFNH